MEESSPLIEPEALLAHVGWMRRLARELVLDPNRAEDTVQQTLLVALERRPTRRGSLTAWLATAVRNTARQAKRSEARLERREALASKHEALPPTSELVEEAELQRRVTDAVLEIEEPYLTTLLLRYWRDLSPSEIARRQEIAPGTVRSRLQRGLAQVRERLDRAFGGDRAAWSGLLLPMALPEKVVGVVSATSRGGKATATLVMSGKSKLLVAIGVLFAASIVWTFYPGPEQPPTNADRGSNGLPVAGSPVESGASVKTPAEPSEPAVRIPIAGETDERTGPEDRHESVEPGPIHQRIRVLSWGGQRLAGCSVQVETEGRMIELVTDSLGRCEFEHDAEASWSLSAQDGDRSRSGTITPMSFMGKVADPLDVRLYELVEVHGRVQLADESPAAGARVTARIPGLVFGRGTPEEAVCTADTEGAFAMQLEADAGSYELRAEWRDLEPHLERVTLTAEGPRELLLRFRDPLEWCGTVVEPSGEVVENARVHVLSANPRAAGRTPFPRQTVVTDSRGAFHCDARPEVPFILIAEHPSWSSSDPLELDPELLGVTSPVLRLVEPTEIAGRVVQEDGSPAVDLFVGATCDGESVREESGPEARYADLLCGTVTTRTDADGRFRLHPVRPGRATYAVTCLSDPAERDRSVRVTGVAAGRTDLLVTLSEERLRGSVVRVTATLADTGSPLEHLEAILYRRRADGAWWQEGSVRTFESPAGSFEIEGLTAGETYAMQIARIAGYLPAWLEPWEASKREHACEVRLRRPIRVQLVVPDSATGEVPLVVVEPLDPRPWKSGAAGRPDDNGRLTLGLCPDRFVAFVRGPEGQRLAETEFEVLSSSDGLEIRLSR